MNEPVQKSVRVHCSVEHAFQIFTEKISLWWPPEHFILRRKAKSKLILEGHVGGRFYEKSETGEVYEFGEVLQWNPPTEIKYYWYLGTSKELPTEVNIQFSADGEYTQVDVIHKEVESLGESWSQKAGKFTKSWEHILEAIKRFLETNGAS